MRIAITTPSGNVGRHIVAMLARAGVRPLLLMRDPNQLAPEVRAAVDTAVVDQFSADSIVEATKNIDALYWVNPNTGGPDPLADYRMATTSVIRAVTENDIPRVVFQSSIGAEKRIGVGEIDGLGATELALDETSAAVTHLRCGYFFSNLEMQLDQIRTGMLQVLLPLDQPQAWVAPRDIAEVAVTRLLQADWQGRHVQAVHGPEDLSWNQVSEIISKATGWPLEVEQIDVDIMRNGLREVGLPDTQIEAIIGMSTGFMDGFVPEQPRSIQTTTPTTLASWAYGELRPRL